MQYVSVAVDSTEVQELKSYGWILDGVKIKKIFTFSDFNVAFSFMTAVALEAEKHNHHPEWSNVYNRVEIAWTTHDVAGLTTLDIQMARFCDRNYAQKASQEL